MDLFSEGLPDEDSNLDYRLQRPVCCHYTIGESCR